MPRLSHQHAVLRAGEPRGDGRKPAALCSVLGMMESCSAHKLPNSGWMGNLHQLQPRTSRVSSAVCQKLVLWSQARSRAGKRASGSRPGSAPTHHLAVPVRSASAIPPPLRAHRLPGRRIVFAATLVMTTSLLLPRHAVDFIRAFEV